MFEEGGAQAPKAPPLPTSLVAPMDLDIKKIVSDQVTSAILEK